MAKKVTTNQPANEAVAPASAKSVKAEKSKASKPASEQASEPQAPKPAKVKGKKASEQASKPASKPKAGKASDKVASKPAGKSSKSVKVESEPATSDYLAYSYRANSATTVLSDSGEFSLTKKGTKKYCAEFASFLGAYKKHSIVKQLFEESCTYMYEHPLFWQLNQIFASEKITAKSALNVAKTAKSLTALVNSIAKKAKHEAVVSEVKLGTQTLYYLGSAEPVVQEVDDKCLKVWAFCGYDKTNPAQNELIDFINTYLRDKFGRKFHEHLYTCVQKLAEQNLERKAMNKALGNVYKSLCLGETGEQVAQNLTKLIK